MRFTGGVHDQASMSDMRPVVDSMGSMLRARFEQMTPSEKAELYAEFEATEAYQSIRSVGQPGRDSMFYKGGFFGWLQKIENDRETSKATDAG